MVDFDGGNLRENLSKPMNTLHINPPGIDGEYLECLNAAFRNWGDRRQFEWYFRRETIFPAADLLVFREDGMLTAGSGITYRRLRLPDEEEICIGIITGSWTLPKHRGKGLFSQLIENSLKHSATKGAELLLAFVTADGVSCRHLQNIGATLFPSFYLRSTESTPTPDVDGTFGPIELSETIVAEMFEGFAASGERLARIAYPAAADFRAQFLERPQDIEVFSNQKGDFAVVEKRNDTNLVQLFLPHEPTRFIADLLAYTLRRNRKFFTFTMAEETAALGEDLGLEIKPGFMAVLAESVSVRLPSGLRWQIQSGDRA